MGARLRIGSFRPAHEVLGTIDQRPDTVFEHFGIDEVLRVAGANG